MSSTASKGGSASADAKQQQPVDKVVESLEVQVVCTNQSSFSPIFFRVKPVTRINKVAVAYAGKVQCQTSQLEFSLGDRIVKLTERISDLGLRNLDVLHVKVTPLATLAHSHTRVAHHPGTRARLLTQTESLPHPTHPDPHTLHPAGQGAGRRLPLHEGPV